MLNKKQSKMNRLTITNLSKTYPNGVQALNKVSLDIKAGMFGLLGPNGAGKSTLMRIIATLQDADTGTVTLGNLDVLQEKNKVRKVLGYLPQEFGLYPKVSAQLLLNHLAVLKGITHKQERKAVVEALLHKTNLYEARKRKLGSFSGGMKQRVGIAQTLLNDPKIIIFDEPTVGLDPEERVRFRNLISDLAQDCIVILSSHIVSDIDTIADQVAVMKDGTLLSQGNQEQLIKLVDQKVFEIIINKEELKDFKTNHIIVSTARKEGNLSVRYISENPMIGSKSKKANLEDAYLYLTKTN